MSFFLQGLTLGLAYVAPIGMQNMFIINSALNNTRRRAFLTALIVLFFDITLSLACFFGIGRLMELFPTVEMFILGAGSLLVLYIGVGLMRAKAETQGEYRPMTIRKTISEAGIVTWINPPGHPRRDDAPRLLSGYLERISADALSQRRPLRFVRMVYLLERPRFFVPQPLQSAHPAGYQHRLRRRHLFLRLEAAL